MVKSKRGVDRQSMLKYNIQWSCDNRRILNCVYSQVRNTVKFVYTKYDLLQ